MPANASNPSGSSPRYGSGPASTNGNSTSSRSSSGSSPGGGVIDKATSGADEHCHFAYSQELRMVDSLVSMLAQNGRGQGGGSASSGQR